VPGIAHQRERRPDGEVGVDEHHLGARHHQLAHVPAADREHLVDEAALLAVEHGVGGDEGP
jgi:hypothetical protein